MPQTAGEESLSTRGQACAGCPPVWASVWTGEGTVCCEKEGGCGEQTAKIHPPQLSGTHEEGRFSLPHVCIQV